MQPTRFVDLSKGVFYLVAALSLVVMMFMFLTVWQPVWVKGFRDFHTISGAISELNKTIKPGSDVAPLLLGEFKTMNTSLDHIEASMQAIEEMRTTMANMSVSIAQLEEINPNMVRINNSVDHMGRVLSEQMGVMNYEVDRMSDKFSPFGMMPFNW